MRSFEAQFQARGFLADEFTVLSPKLREANAAWFAIAEKTSDALNRCVARAMESVRGTSASPKVIATLIAARAAGNFQGALLLLSRGMVVESRTLVRSCVEASICLAALYDTPDEFSDLLKIDDHSSRRSQAKFILDHKLVSDGAELDRLQALVRTLEKGSNLPIRKLAEAGAYSKLYLYYKMLSHDAAHISARALRRHMLSSDGSWNGFLWGPDDPEVVADTLNLATLVICGAGVALTQILDDAQGNKDFADISNEHLALQST